MTKYYKQLLGQRFGSLVVIGPSDPIGRRARWLCRCDCGNEKAVQTDYLKSGHVKTCGCGTGIKDQYPNRTIDHIKGIKVNTHGGYDLEGCVFSRLTVIRFAGTRLYGKDKKKSRTWECKCVCGNYTITSSGALVRGSTKSCGCLSREIAASGRRTHGLSKSPLSYRWNDMKARCYNPKSVGYKDYGGRGITVCDEWKNDFKAFYDWAHATYPDIEEMISAGFQLDRINVNGNYEPENCRFVTRKENIRNQRQTNFLVFKDGAIPLAQFIEDLSKLMPDLTYQECQGKMANLFTSYCGTYKYADSGKLEGVQGSKGV